MYKWKGDFFILLLSKDIKYELLKSVFVIFENIVFN